MNNIQFIARYMALGAILTGVSSQAIAQQDCPINVTCPTGDAVLTVDDTDQWGEDFIPDQDTVQNAVMLDQFDRAFYANLHNVNESEIELLGVELEVRFDLTRMEVGLSNPDTDCNFNWSWEPKVTLLANAGVGTGNILLTIPEQGEQNVQITAGAGVAYAWDLFTDGPGLQSVSECDGFTNNLNPWIGNGQISWDLFFESIPQIIGCGNADLNRNIEGLVVVEVRYKYCFEDEIIITEGCECLTPSPNYRRPGSLLLFPEFDTRDGEYTVITVTNVDCIQNTGENIDVEFVFIDEDGCGEFNKTISLTPCDTYTFLASALNPNPERGYMYAFAKQYDGANPNGTPISWNYLIGNEMVISGFSFFDYSMNPVVFRSSLDDGVVTDLDGDGYRDLDGSEYEPAPNIITIPRYFGQDGVTQDPGLFNSQLILIGLTGGQRFDTTACILYYNDNEEVFSTEWTWRCWDKPYLLDINFGFGNDWLHNNTDDDDDEIFGESDRESGWICIEGCQASSDSEAIDNPAIYAVLVEHVGTLGIADLPFECGIRTNGTLLPRGQFGDPDNDTDGDGDVDDEDAEDGDNQ